MFTCTVGDVKQFDFQKKNKSIGAEQIHSSSKLQNEKALTLKFFINNASTTDSQRMTHKHA